jgi:hypothetical protein
VQRDGACLAGLFIEDIDQTAEGDGGTSGVRNTQDFNDRGGHGGGRLAGADHDDGRTGFGGPTPAVHLKSGAVSMEDAAQGGAGLHGGETCAPDLFRICAILEGLGRHK